jgi:Trypsin-like peptidase domain
VHAIGHPTGEYWTYTKGVVSQFRPNYPWSADGTGHRANVIQTQTPINPGNSGGPLLSDDGKLVGVNSFKSIGSDGLNFAVAASEVREFLNAPVAVGQCDWKVVFEGRNSVDNAFIRQFSKCDSFPALVFVYPDDKSVPFKATLDSKHRNKVDAVILDQTRSGKWDFSVWDLNFDDTFISIGKHPDGKLWPSSYAPRCPGQIAAVNFQCK